MFVACCGFGLGSRAITCLGSGPALHFQWRSLLRTSTSLHSRPSGCKLLHISAPCLCERHESSSFAKRRKGKGAALTGQRSAVAVYISAVNVLTSRLSCQQVHHDEFTPPLYDARHYPRLDDRAAAQDHRPPIYNYRCISSSMPRCVSPTSHAAVYARLLSVHLESCYTSPTRKRWFWNQFDYTLHLRYTKTQPSGSLYYAGHRVRENQEQHQPRVQSVPTNEALGVLET